ncbi:serine/threonine-protein kinase (plasmid) [Mycolicibacterium psychrotolerans]|uniref:serine/threonine-protein kinase n=1 Tax=Mycolicibacterium psychrotolerans TaxID=216929 RepID=UPI003D679226
MEGEQVELRSGSWLIGALIDVGGAGAVYEATRLDGMPAAAKFVIGGPTSKREFEFDNLEGAAHIMPLLDTGAHKGNLVIVMPRAETNLRDIINEHPAGLPLEDSLPILQDIASGLAELANAGVVHRDVKPENILRYDGRWVLADFGIARHATVTTATHTHRAQFTPQYAAPEQWNHERVTHKTDIYAFGVTACELLHGRRPFHAIEGDEEALGRAHREQPVHLTGVPTLLYYLLEQCLTKPPELRPTAENLLSGLDRVINKAANLPGLQDLLAAYQGVQRDRAEFALMQAAEERDSQRFNEMLKIADQQLIRISDEFVEAINSTIPIQYAGASRRGVGQWAVQLGMAKLEFSGCFGAQRHGPPTPYTLIAGAILSVSFPRSGGNYTGRNHSLWYADLQAENEFGWYEIAFAATPGRRRSLTEPYDVRPSWDAGSVLAGTSQHHQVVWPVTLWRPGDLDEPINRWAQWFAAAIEGTLQRPSQIPERPVDGTWRRPSPNDAEPTA